MFRKLILLAFILLFTACSNNLANPEIDSITVTIKPSYGIEGEIVTSQWVVSAGGAVTETKTSDKGELISYKEYLIPQDSTQELIEIFYAYDFFSLPDHLSTESDDGSYITIAVETKQGVIEKGGLNPNNEKFQYCMDSFLKYIAQGSNSTIKVVKFGTGPEDYLEKGVQLDVDDTQILMDIIEQSLQQPATEEEIMESMYFSFYYAYTFYDAENNMAYLFELPTKFLNLATTIDKDKYFHTSDFDKIEALYKKYIGNDASGEQPNISLSEPSFK